MLELKVSNKRDILRPNIITFEEREQQIIEKREQEEIELQRAKRSPFKTFAQLNMSDSSTNAIYNLVNISPLAFNIFMFLTKHMDNYNAVMCSYKVMQEQFGISKDTIRRAIKVLKDYKFLEIYKSGTSNVYCLNKNIVWSSWGTNHKYAKFGANIILSESEQPKKKTKSEKVKQVKIKEN